jgi:hypothetical protein
VTGARRRIVLVAVVATTIARHDVVFADEATEPLRQLMIDLGLRPLCEMLGAGVVRCQADLASTHDEPSRPLVVTHSIERGLLTIALPRLATIPPDAPRANRALRRLWALQATLELARLEWDPSSGEIRLAVVLPFALPMDAQAVRRSIQEARALSSRLAPGLTEIARTSTL